MAAKTTTKTTTRGKVKAKQWDGTISDEQMLRLKAARHKHAEEVLERVMRNEPLMAQLRESIAALERGDPGTTRAELEAEWKARRGE